MLVQGKKASFMSKVSCQHEVQKLGANLGYMPSSSMILSFHYVNSELPLPLKSKLKVWERDTGNLHSVSEPKSFMGEIVEWMPFGAKIATVCDHKEEGGCPSINFFERNGLERSSFSVNEGIDATIENLKWNCNSDLLAAIVRRETYDSIKIWLFNNNHWYLKQEIRYLKQEGVRFMWDPVKPLQLICWTLEGLITVYNFIWITAVTENSVALVVDGSKILVTTLSLSVIPPPMYLFELEFPCSVREMAFWSKNSKNRLAVSMSDGSLSVVELPSLDTWEELEGKVFGISEDLTSFLHLTWLDSHVLLGRYTSFVQLNGGNIFEYSSELDTTAGSLQEHNDLRFSSSCPWMSVAPVEDFGLSEYFLFVVDIRDIMLGQTEAKYGNFVPVISRRMSEEEKKFIQIWEKGSKILGVVHGDESVVILQTTRGNLESIYPRKLVLESIINALVQGSFKDALLMVRRRRIDFNVIVDHGGWQAFLQLATEFVRHVDNLSYITEFVCSLKDENVMETFKVNSVLLAVRKALEEQIVESSARELCILTTLARTDPPSLEEALERVKVIREMELSDCNDPKRKHFPSAEESLKHLLWLSESEAVYETALGLYDLNLAAIVALNSQQDPKEFLPFLQELEVLPSVIMRYRIDLKLRRFEKALKHIAAAGDAYFEDFVNLMKKNPELFSLGLQLVTDPTKRRQVLEAWGDHLSDIKCFEDAATTYMCCSSLEKALKAYRSSNNWSGVLTVAGLIKLGKEEILQLAHELCEELQTLGKPVRQRRLLLAAKLQSNERSVNELDDDTVSEASSSFSGMSAYSTG
ncbi:hypothetical protein L6452_14333 [Arctium lappa]|uniref:Uncharacterized protein n=1 Tax=Arctium lappa TaxID=4217 RepID=A0ACB9CL02_ARCLA|nr:hypothetical protein L6452_14333 [Arctium lappa]